MKFKRTSEFGDLELIRDHPHSGIDYAMPENTPIESILDGVVKQVVDYRDVNSGKTVIVEMDNGQTAIYGHLNQFSVKEGQEVSAGDIIGLSGNTGHSSGPHLHFGIKDDGEFIDPSAYDPLIQQMGDEKGWWGRTLDWMKDNGQVDTYQGASGSDDPSWGAEIGIWLLEKIGDGIAWTFTTIVENTYAVLPEIGAAATVIAGAGMMVTGKIGKVGFYYSIVMTGVVIWKIFGFGS